MLSLDNCIPEKIRNGERIGRRMLVEDMHGNIGVLHLSYEGVSSDAATEIARKLGFYKAIYCDVGMYDKARIFTHKNGKEKPTVKGHIIGWHDKEGSSNRLIFYNPKFRRKEHTEFWFKEVKDEQVLETHHL